MEVITAKSAGFCFGVQRGVDLVNQQLEKGKSPIYTYGPIIHNEEVVNELAKKGVLVMSENPEDHYEKGTVIIRSHGVTREVIERLENDGHEIVDATCPFVKKIHKIVQDHSAAGEHILIIGNPTHPEVKGIVGWIVGDDYTVFSKIEEAQEFCVNIQKTVCIVSQTTFNHNKFQELVEIIRNKGYHISVLNTICSATRERQEEAERIASNVDAMIVIGSPNSSNTQKLFEICNSKCKNTYYIQTVGDLQLPVQQSISYVGITAGASTPKNIIEEVQTHVRKF